MSRFTGGWVSLKCVHDTVESTASIPVDPARPAIVLPDDFTPPPDGLNLRWPDNGLGQKMALAQEQRVHTHKLDAARAFARANRLDRVVLGGEGARLGIVTTGKSWLDVSRPWTTSEIDDAARPGAGTARLQGRHDLAAGAGGAEPRPWAGSSGCSWSRRSGPDREPGARNCSTICRSGR